MFLFQPDIEDFEVHAITYVTTKFKHYNWMVRGNGPRSLSPNGHAIIRCETKEDALREAEVLRKTLGMSVQEQMACLWLNFYPNDICGNTKILLHACARAFGITYRSDMNAFYEPRTTKSLSIGEFMQLTQKCTPEPVWGCLEEVEQNDSFGIGAPAAPKGWEPDEIDPGVDIMDSIRRACNGR